MPGILSGGAVFGFQPLIGLYDHLQQLIVGTLFQGKSAHSFWQGKRFYYDESFTKVNDGNGGSEQEAIMLGLRLNAGIEKNLVKKDFKKFVKMGFIAEKGNKISLTPQGMLVSNTIINELI